MEPDRSDTNLLFGILAVKMNFIAKEDLFEAMGIWFLDRSKALGEILVERGSLSGQDRQLLNAMVRESQARQGQPAKSGSRDRTPTPPGPNGAAEAAETPPGDPIGYTVAGDRPDVGEMTVSWSSARDERGDEPTDPGASAREDGPTASQSFFWTHAEPAPLR